MTECIFTSGYDAVHDTDTFHQFVSKALRHMITEGYPATYVVASANGRDVLSAIFGTNSLNHLLGHRIRIDNNLTNEFRFYADNAEDYSRGKYASIFLNNSLYTHVIASAETDTYVAIGDDSCLQTPDGNTSNQSSKEQ